MFKIPNRFVDLYWVDSSGKTPKKYWKLKQIEPSLLWINKAILTVIWKWVLRNIRLSTMVKWHVTECMNYNNNNNNNSCCLFSIPVTALSEE
jgi:hypothetical protein